MGINAHHTGALRTLELAPFEFHLTGSRYFGTADQGSDWDFFVEAQPFLPGWLDANGFLRDSESDYVSWDITEVWYHAHDSVHVQIVSDARRKVAVQAGLRNSGYANWMYRLPKADRKQLWNLANHMLQVGRESTTAIPPW